MSKDADQIFLGFVEYNKFKELGLDESNIKIDTCARFVFLTKSRVSYSPYVDASKVDIDLDNGDAEPIVKNFHV